MRAVMYRQISLCLGQLFCKLILCLCDFTLVKFGRLQLLLQGIILILEAFDLLLQFACFFRSCNLRRSITLNRAEQCSVLAFMAAAMV